MNFILACAWHAVSDENDWSGYTTMSGRRTNRKAISMLECFLPPSVDHHQFNTVNQQIWYSFAEFVNSFGPKTMSIGLTGGSLIWIFNRNFSQNWEIESRTNQWTMSISIYYQQNIAWTHRIREQVLIFPRESDEAETELIEHLQTNWNIFEYFAYFSPPTQLFVPYRIILR